MIHPIILKFGGTSVSNGKTVQTIAAIVQSTKGKNPVVVVSALSGVTDLLLSLTEAKPKEAKQIIATIRLKHKVLVEELWQDEKQQAEVLSFIDKQLTYIFSLLSRKKRDKAWVDLVISHGEIMSSYIISQWLTSQGSMAKQVLASSLIVTDSNFGSAEYIFEPTEKNVKKIINPLLKKGITPVVTGFVGANQKGETTTLGRGGSDYSASILGLSLQAAEVQIWTDVDGIFTADPRLIPSARSIAEVSYKEASEMAFFGAKVLHPRTIRPAMRANIPVRVLNTFNPKQKGTRIVASSLHSNTVKTISFKRKTTLVNIYATEMFLAKGFFLRIFEPFAKSNISIDLISASEVSVSVTLDNDQNLENALEKLRKFSRVSVEKEVATVSLIGEGLTASTHIIKNIFSILATEGIIIKMVSFGAADSNITLVIAAKDMEHIVKILHASLIIEGGGSK